MSFRVLNAILATTSGRSMPKENRNSIIRQLDADENLYIKIWASNMYGSDGYSGDEYHDQMIEALIKMFIDYCASEILFAALVYQQTLKK